MEIVQQLEFTTSAANSQPQQISTNVTVKALTNTSVKSEPGVSASGGGPGGAGSGPGGGSAQGSASGGGAGGGGNDPQHNGNNNNNRGGMHMGSGGGGVPNSATNIMGGHNMNTAQQQQKPNMGGLGNLVECKREPDHDFPDLAGLEKEGGPNSNFPGFPEFMADDTAEGNETFKDLINDLQDFNPGFLDALDEKPLMDIKTEDGIKVEPPNVQALIDSLNVKSENAMAQFNAAFGGPNAGGPNVGGGGGMGGGGPMGGGGGGPNSDPQGMNKMRSQFQNGPNTGPMSELSLAAQTLKQMAEQHQNKNAMGGMNFPRPPMHQGQQSQLMGGGGGGGPNGRYNDYVGGFGGPNDFMQSPNGPQQHPQHQNIPPQFQHKGQGPGGPMGGSNVQQSFLDIKQELYYSSQQNEFDLKRLQHQQQMQQQQQHMSQANMGKMGPNGPMGVGNFPKPNGQGQQQSQTQNPTQQPQYSPYNSPMGPGGGGGAGSQGTAGPNFMQGPPRGPGGGVGPNQQGPSNGPSNMSPVQQQQQSQQQQTQNANARGPNAQQNTPNMGNNGPNPNNQNGPNSGSGVGGPGNGPSTQQGNSNMPQQQSQQQQQTTTTTLQMKQTQQLHISQQGGAHGIQVSEQYFFYIRVIAV